jgi:hypothetical protein
MPLLATFAALFAHLNRERQLKAGAQGAPNNRTVERERRLPRRLERFLPRNVDRVGNISENSDTEDG